MPGATTKPDQPTQAGAVHSAGQRWAGRGELIAKVGTVISAIMASSCCWLPVLLLTVGVSGAGIASALEAYRPIFMAVTFSFLAMAFYFTYRPRKIAASELDCCAEPVVEGTGTVPTSPGSSPSLAKLDIPAPASGGKWRFNMMAMNKVMLWGVTVLAVVFLFFPSTVTGLLGSGTEQVTAGMTRTELRIKGMTCDG